MAAVCELGVQLLSGRMKKAVTACRLLSRRRFLVPLLVLGLIFTWILSRHFFSTKQKLLSITVDPDYRKRVHSYVKSVLAKECRPSFTRKKITALYSNSVLVTEPFLQPDRNPKKQIFKYPPPFGFLNLQDKLGSIMHLISKPVSEKPGKEGCRRCVVIGNGGILQGLELGPLLNEFDVVIRLNSGPVRGYSKDVGNRTTIRMSYPEGSPKIWEDIDPQLQFVAVIYKAVDFKWLQAMMTGSALSLWDKLYFWQKVPDRIPVHPSKIQVMNPEIISEAALDLLRYSKPQPRLWGWDQNVPTLGFSAVNLASYLCDEVGLAGFGYKLPQKEAPLHYYDNIPMTAMLKQTMHNVDREHAALQNLAASGSIADLTGGVYCVYC